MSSHNHRNCTTVQNHHAPQIVRGATRIVGCTCGWRTPTGTTNSDDTFAEHVATTKAGRP